MLRTFQMPPVEKIGCFTSIMFGYRVTVCVLCPLQCLKLPNGYCTFLRMLQSDPQMSQWSNIMYLGS